MVFLNANEIMISSITRQNRLLFCPKPDVVQYKLVFIHTKENNDAFHKNGIIEKQIFALAVQIYDVHVCNAGVVEVEGVFIDLDTLIEVVVR